jgi:hypothetical protein
MRQLRPPVHSVLVALFLLGHLTGVSATRVEHDKPIIANVIADAQSFDGKHIVIYGLVIETSHGGKVFLLQDVSQIPLKIVGRDGLIARVGDQLLVQGVFHNGNEPYVQAESLTPTKVLGGGGCC